MTAEISHPQHNITNSENLVRRERSPGVACPIDGETAQAVIDSLADISPALAHHIAAFSSGDVYSRPSLNPRSRQLVTTGVPTALGGCELQLRIHIGVAFNVELTREEIIEVILYASVYAGFPRVLSAIFVAHEVLTERDATD